MSDLQDILDGLNTANMGDSFVLELGKNKVFPKHFEETLTTPKKERIKEDLEQQFYLLREILPEPLQEGFYHLYIAGGAIYSLWNEDVVSDYDFFSDDQGYLLQLRGYFSQFVQHESEYVSRGSYKGFKLTITNNAISIGKWQIITNWWGKADDVVEEFDFKHTQSWYDGELYLTDEDFLSDNMLWYNENRARDFVGSLLRVPYFIEKGFHITKSEMAKIIQRLEKQGFSEKDKETLESLLEY